MESNDTFLTATQASIGPGNNSQSTQNGTVIKSPDVIKMQRLQTSVSPILFIDSAVDNVDTLIEGVQPGIKVVLLRSDHDGVEQITETLRSQSGISELHIVSHGSPGCLYLGNTELSLETLSHYAQTISGWKELSDASALYLYGCNLAAGDAGAEFIERLHHIAHMPIAASRTKTGNSALGGNWQLEVRVGRQNREFQQPFTAKAKASYSGIFTSAQLVRDINPNGGSYPSGYNAVEVDGQLFFTADDGTSGRELWVSDGTTEGTQLLRDINPDNSSNNYYYYSPSPSNLTEVNGTLFFTANDGTTGSELWVSDGTTEGTQLVQDINPSSDNYPAPYNFIDVDGRLFFTASDGATGRELWVSDGTTEGTQLVRDINPSSDNYPTPNNFIEVGGKLFFTASDGATGRELWVSDGTTEGTQLVRDINPSSDNYPAPYNFIEVDGKLFFTASDGTTGQELWVSDGTTEGTQLVRDINPSSDNYPAPYNFIEVDGKLFFTASDGTTGRELWVSDGTTEGTQLVRDINPSSNSYPAPYNFIEVDGKLFFTASDGTTGQELWVSDGTTEGTQLVRDINPSSNSYPAPYNFIEVDGKLFFTADDGTTGRELWVSDGTTEGTQLVRDINPDNSGDGYYSYAAPYNLTAVGGLLFFTADDGASGRELWISDGTTEGTQLFQDINPGSDGSSPSNFNVVGNQLFFTANDGTTGEELWTLSVPSNIVAGDDDNNILNGTAEADFINGVGGNDIIRGRNGSDIINGGSDDDALFGNRGNDALNGNSGNDQVFGDRGDDTLQGGAGNDVLNGGGGNDTVIVNDFSGVDSFDGGAGTDLIRFQPTDGRNLTIFLAQGSVGDGRSGGQLFENFEQIETGRGDDRLLGDDQANSLNSGAGNDTILGGNGRDTLFGGSDQDELFGEAGRDELIGGIDSDTLIGGGGADILTGGQGSDVLIGDGGADIFRFGGELLEGQADVDTIENFQTQDSFDFTDYLGAGGSIEATRVTPGLLRLDLNGEDIVNVFGNQSSLNAAESQLADLS
ncbi:Bifunctional hemolysin/adenylate cyclase [Acaryochloris thomasi RCC1774]|uniref:Bifunctional hemolysin/adenylate cyclase n=1 Tax=Acaryochloris thomasi RCC1774 TaxID=1764569 RepID=A0A2W1JVH1_9CYAN|nr:ELWxxDGT repeat protein [Acaryochloris thomasi]PZD74452.1 Bifunctional hemolysin/adenylate cyclase [Acaryochloris thomasi RCC1774]